MKRPQKLAVMLVPTPPYEICGPGHEIDLGNGATAMCVAVGGRVINHGAVTGATAENDLSTAILVRYGDFEYITAGDLGGGDADRSCTDQVTSQANVETPLALALTSGSPPLLSGDGLKVLDVNHDGSESSTNIDYMNLSSPSLAVINTGPGQGSTWHHPRIDILESVLMAQAPCITVDLLLEHRCSGQLYHYRKQGWGLGWGDSSCGLFDETCLANCIIWNNQADSRINSPDSSIFIENGASIESSSATISHSLIENYDLLTFGVGNLNGNAAGNSPRFVGEIDGLGEPNNAPESGGDFRLLGHSLLIDAGSSTDATGAALELPALDLAGKARIVPETPIDLGAYENGVLISAPGSPTELTFLSDEGLFYDNVLN